MREIVEQDGQFTLVLQRSPSMLLLRTSSSASLCPVSRWPSSSCAACPSVRRHRRTSPERSVLVRSTRSTCPLDGTATWCCMRTASSRIRCRSLRRRVRTASRWSGRSCSAAALPSRHPATRATDGRSTMRFAGRISSAASSRPGWVSRGGPSWWAIPSARSRSSSSRSNTRDSTTACWPCAGRWVAQSRNSSTRATRA